MLIWLNKKFGRIQEVYQPYSHTKRTRRGRTNRRGSWELVCSTPSMATMKLGRRSIRGQAGGATMWSMGLMITIVLLALAVGVLLPIAVQAGVLSFLAAKFFSLPAVKDVFKVLMTIVCAMQGSIDTIYGISHDIGDTLSDALDTVGSVVKFAADGVGGIPIIGGTLKGMVNVAGGAVTLPVMAVKEASDLATGGLALARSLSSLACSLKKLVDQLEASGYKDAFQKALDCSNWDPLRYGPLNADQNQTADHKPKYCIDSDQNGGNKNFFLPPWLVNIYQHAATKYNVPWQVLAAINLNDTNLGQDPWAVASSDTGGRVGWIPFTSAEWYKEASNDAGGTAPRFYGSPYTGKKGFIQVHLKKGDKGWSKNKPWKSIPVPAKTCPIPLDVDGNPYTGMTTPSGSLGGDSLKDYKGGKLTPTQVGQLMLDAGFPPEEIVPGIAIVGAESGYDPNSTYGDATGLWQEIKHGSVADEKDPVKSTKIALGLYSSDWRGHTNGWNQWQTFTGKTSGGYKTNPGAMHYNSAMLKYLKDAKKAAKELNIDSQYINEPQNTWGTHEPNNKKTSVSSPVLSLPGFSAPRGSVTYTGLASTYANDPAIGWVDGGDNNIPALPGATNNKPGIAVCIPQNKPKCEDTSKLGGWWSVKTPGGATAILQQTDSGPGASGVILDVNAVAARTIFGVKASAFPTREGKWTVTYLGKKKPPGANAVATGGPLLGNEKTSGEAAGSTGISQAIVAVKLIPDAQYDNCDPVDSIYGLAKYLKKHGAVGAVWTDVAVDSNFIDSTMSGPMGSRIVQIAKGELDRGVHESPAGSNDSPDIARYRKAVAGNPGVGPWCAYFVSWVMRQAGVPILEKGAGTAGVGEIERWGKAKKIIFTDPKKAQPGDIIIYNHTEHTGIVEKNDNGKITSIEGNCSDKVCENTNATHGSQPITGFVRPQENPDGPPPLPDSAPSSSGSAPSGGAGAPKIVKSYIPFPAKRKAEMAAYAKRHYTGVSGYQLKDPKVIVEHYTESSTYSSAYNTFAPDTADQELHELPGVCAHFIVDKDGTIHQLVPLTIMCRHTVGLNYTAIGIEMVGSSESEIIGRKKQYDAVIKLTQWLQSKYGIDTKNVIGHNESLSSKYHKENVASLKTQTHDDWKKHYMDAFRKKLGNVMPSDNIKAPATPGGTPGPIPACFEKNKKHFPTLTAMLAGGQLKINTCLSNIDPPDLDTCKALGFSSDSKNAAQVLLAQADAAGETFGVSSDLLKAIFRVQSAAGCDMPDDKIGRGWLGISDQIWKHWAVNTRSGEGYTRMQSVPSFFTAARFLASKQATKHQDQALQAYFAGDPDAKKKIKAVVDSMANNGVPPGNLKKGSIGRAIQDRNYRINKDLQIGDEQPCKDSTSYVQCIAAIYKLIIVQYSKPTDAAEAVTLGGGCGKVEGNKIKDLSDLPDLRERPYQTGPKDVVLNKERKGINITDRPTWGRKDAMNATVSVIKAFQACFPAYKKNWQKNKIDDWGSKLVAAKYDAPGHVSHVNGADNDTTIIDVTNFNLGGKYDQQQAIVLAALFLRAGAFNIYFDDPEVQKFFHDNRANEAKQHPDYPTKYKAWSSDPVTWAFSGGAPANKIHHNHMHVRWYTGGANAFPPTVRTYIGKGADTVDSSGSTSSNPGSSCSSSHSSGSSSCQYGPYGGRQP